MCTKNCGGCNDCLEVICTSDITCFDGEFQVIVVPEGSDLNDVLALLEAYITDSIMDINMFTLVEPNTLGLVAGTYSYQQIVTAVNVVLNNHEERIDTLEGDVDDLETDVIDHEIRIDDLEANPIPFKFIKEFTSDFDNSSLTISQVELATAGVLPTGTIQGALPQEFSDLHIQVWYLLSGSWRLFNTENGGGEANIIVNDATGLITVTLNVTPIDPVNVACFVAKPSTKAFVLA